MRDLPGWLWFVVVQLIMAAATAVGWLLLVPFCLLHFWEKNATSIGDGHRAIDVWKWVWLSKIYGNPEDGVSGQTALIWINPVQQGPYDPYPASWPQLTAVDDSFPRHMYVLLAQWLWDAWRAWHWSAWRNSCDNLKYVFAWKNGPRAEWKGHKLGWWPENGFNVPVF